MKFVLLPGMDGTGELFSEFISFLEVETTVISLSQYGAQDHKCLAKSIKEQLPEEDCFLLAESFSGGIVPELLVYNSHRIKGIIFVASFLSCPNKFLLQIAKYLPLKTLASVPFSEIAHKLLFLGQDASHELLSKFRTVTNSIPEQVLKDRLTVMSCQELPLETFDIPVAYIQANSDKLISTVKSRELSKVFKNIEYFEIDGPHFILQSKPSESAKMVSQAIHSLII